VKWGIPRNFPGLLQRLDIREIPGPRFDLADLVLPVALVDPGDSPLQANAVPPVIGAPFSAGELVGPVAGTRLADTGQLAAGTYWFVFTIAGNTGTNDFRLGRRNAADAAWVWSQRYFNPVNSPLWVGPLRVTLAANERLAAEVVTNFAGTSQANLYVAAV